MFISRHRASMDDRSPWGDFWFSPVGGTSSAGVMVTADGAMRLGAVYSCVRVLAESFAVLPFKLYRPKVGGGRTVVTDHWAYTLFTRRPNQFQNRFEFREMLQGHLTLRGNAYCEIVDGAGGVAQLLPRHPDRIQIETVGEADWRYVYMDRTGTQRRIRRDQMWHIRGLSGDGIVGFSPIEVQRDTIGGGLAAQDYGNRFFMNDAKPSGGWIEYPGKIADKAQRATLGETIREAISGRNRHKILTLDQGMKYHEVGVSNKDSQFLESRGYTRSEIAGIFRVPPHMIGDLSRATFSNIEQQSIDFWQNTMLPWCERWEAAVESLIADDALEVEFDFRNLMRGDAASRAAYFHNGVLDGWLTRNEARELEGYDPIEGLDEPLVPVNERNLNDPDPDGMDGASDAATDTPDSQTPADGQAPADPDGDAEDDKADKSGQASADVRIRDLVASNAARLARRIVRGAAAGKFMGADTIAEGLAVSTNDAQSWLNANYGVSVDEESIGLSLCALGMKGKL